MTEKMKFINLAQNEMMLGVCIGQTSNSCSKAEAILNADDCKDSGAWTSGM